MDNNITSIAKTLTKRYATIYYVNLITDHYVEYSASDDYKELNKSLNDAKVFRGYYSGKKQSTQMKDYKVNKTE